MRFSTIIPVALAAAPAAVSASTFGYAIGTIRASDGKCKTQSDYEQDFDVLKAQASIFRGYDASDCDFAKEVLPAAANKKVQIVLGLWPNSTTSFGNGMQALRDNVPGNKDVVAGITVGSETLYRGDETGTSLLAKITQVKEMEEVKGIPVGTADSWDAYMSDNADPVIKGADFLYINAFAYWQGSPIENASHVVLDDYAQASQRIQTVRGSTDVPISLGETGWPTGTVGTYDAAVPGLENAKKFWDECVCGLQTMGINMFVFEAFDEPQKPLSKGKNGEDEDETHWGVYDGNRVAKWDLSCK